MADDLNNFPTLGEQVARIGRALGEEFGGRYYVLGDGRQQITIRDRWTNQPDIRVTVDREEA